MPIAFKRIHYGRDGESVVGLSVEKFERIRAQNVQNDWSAEVIEEASLEDLDEKAIALARTLLLLGKNECEYMLAPADPKIRWILLDANGEKKSHFITGLPFLLAVDEAYSKIRILRYQYMQQEGTLFPEEVDQYDAFTIREALNNCIAHQDYTKGCRINVIEADAQLTFENAGSFIPNSVEQVVKDNSPESFYRNRFLASAMTNLIEGRKPNFIIAKEVLQTAGMKAEYTKNKGMDNQYYRDLVIKALQQHTTLTRKDVNDLLFDKLPEYMTEKQKLNKIGNILGYLRNQNLIINTGSDRQPIWKLRVNYE